MVTERCKSCKYSRKLTTTDKKDTGCEYYCNYICLELKVRPCPAGDECTVYIEKDPNQKQSAYYREYPVKE